LGYSISFKSSVARDLKKLSTADARRVLDQIDKNLIKTPKKYPPLKGDFAGLRKYRVGDFRVIYALAGSDILVLRIAHRKDVYR
jgi:mRNA interferase RelE/StbE